MTVTYEPHPPLVYARADLSDTIADLEVKRKAIQGSMANYAAKATEAEEKAREWRDKQKECAIRASALGDGIRILREAQAAAKEVMARVNQ